MMRKGGGRGETHPIISNVAKLVYNNRRTKWQRIHVVFCIISCLLASSIKLFMHVVVHSPGCNAKQEISSFILKNVTRDVMGGDDDSYTLVVVRCRGNGYRCPVRLDGCGA